MSAGGNFTERLTQLILKQAGERVDTAARGLHSRITAVGNTLQTALNVHIAQDINNAHSGTLNDTKHGNRGGGSLHAVATTSVNGFQSAADKTKQDAYPTVSGLTTGYVLTATGPTAIAFQASSAGFADPMTTIGDLIYRNGSNNTARLGIGSTGHVLTVIGGLPAWQALSGLTNPMTTAGDIITGGASGTPQRLGVGSNGQVLTVVSGAPAWSSAAASGDSTYTAAYGSRPAASNDGNLFLPNNSFYIERDTGSAWASWGPIFPVTPPIDGDFSWVNQNSASVDTTNGGVFLLSELASGVSLNLRKKAAPSTPYTITVHLLPMHTHVTNSGYGIGFRQSSDGKLHVLWIQTATIFSSKLTNSTTFSANYVNNSFNYAPPPFLQISDDGTNRILRYGYDGVHFSTFHSVGRTDFLTANEVFFFVDGRSTTRPTGLTVLSWKES
jgi:hypothetical protein